MKVYSERVIKMDSHKSLEYQDLSSMLQESSEKITDSVWEAITIWIKHDVSARIKYLSRFLSTMGKFDKRTVVDVIIHDPLISGNEKSLALIYDHILSNVDAYSKLLRLENCFKLNTHVELYTDHTGYLKFKKAILEFMAENFNQITQALDYTDISESDIVHLLETENVTNDEGIRWHAILRWIEYAEDRRGIFSKLFKLLDLQWFDRDFIERELSTNELITSSDECKDTIVHFVRAKMASKLHEQTANQNIAALCDQTDTLTTYSNGKLTKVHTADTKDAYSGGKLISIDGKCYIVTRRYLYIFKIDGSSVHQRLQNPGSQYRFHKSCALTFQRCIYVFLKEKLFIFDVDSKEWQIQDHTIKSRNLWSGLSLCSSQDRIFSLAVGFNKRENISYDPMRDERFDMAPFRHCRLPDTHFGSTTLNHSVFIVGGEISNGLITMPAPMEVYNTPTNSWTEIRALPSRNKAISCFTDNGFLFAVGYKQNRYTILRHTDDKWVDPDSVQVETRHLLQIMYTSNQD